MQNAAQIDKVPPDAVEFGFINQMQGWLALINYLPRKTNRFSKFGFLNRICREAGKCINVTKFHRETVVG